MENHEVTELLARWSAGDKQVLDRLLPLVYAELHRVAAVYLRRERLVHSTNTSNCELRGDYYDTLLGPRKKACP